MILLCGIPSEPPTKMVAQALERLSVPFVVFNQRRFADARVTFELVDGRAAGRIAVDGRSYRLEAISAVYTRMMDDRLLPEVRDHPADSPLRRRARALHDALYRFIDLTPGRVVNRTAAMGSNGSKPYQAQLIRQLGFAVPETLITNSPELVLSFRARHGRVIFKSISGQRSIVRTLEDDDVPRLERTRLCPVMFQAYVEGTDVRVHTVGREVFATVVRSSATDYRYADQLGHADTLLEPLDISDDLAGRCARLSEGLGLAFAGIDLRLTPEGEAVCFEVNPCPGFSYYEAHTGQPIARAVARYLADLN
jgi:glutathione synthase/RimK-type ligase-like ATP-grasp enzyme